MTRPANTDLVEYWSSISGESCHTRAEEDACRLADEVLRLRANAQRTLAEGARAERAAILTMLREMEAAERKYGGLRFMDLDQMLSAIERRDEAPTRPAEAKEDQ